MLQPCMRGVMQAALAHADERARAGRVIALHLGAQRARQAAGGHRAGRQLCGLALAGPAAG